MIEETISHLSRFFKNDYASGDTFYYLTFPLNLTFHRKPIIMIIINHGTIYVTGLCNPFHATGLFQYPLKTSENI